jgi:ferredoxin
MSLRVDTSLISELKEYGAENVELCFNCGNCTAICPLSSEEAIFPRSNIRQIQMGLRQRLLSSPDPWLCYYCGECSETCPKQAEPAETQMAVRRWLTAQYDWTGLARLFYTSKFWEVGSVLLMAVLVLVGFGLFHGPVITERVTLNTFAPVETIHILDWIMAGMLIIFLGTNILRMHNFILSEVPEGMKVPISAYMKELWQLPYHFATQRKYSQCDPRGPWVKHLILVAGYVTMLILIVLFLPWFQTDAIYPIYHPQRWIGYLATLALLYGAGAALYGRFKRQSQMHRFSHLSDWMFPVLLLVGAVTGILVHTFRYSGMALATYWMYAIHLAAMAPMLILEVPFGKWAHLAYRPLAIYFQAVKQSAVPVPSPATASVGAD